MSFDGYVRQKGDLPVKFNSSLDSPLSQQPQLLQMIDAQRFKLVGIEIPASVTGQHSTLLKQAIHESLIPVKNARSL
jgi:hypothetical protein